jgi:hypothetical protein
MAETKAEERIRALETSMSRVNFIGFIAALLLLGVLSGIAWTIITLGELREAKAAHTSAIDKINARLDTLFRPIPAGAVVREGQVLKVDGDKIFIRVDDHELTISASKKTKISLAGDKATTGDLRRGMHVRAIIKDDDTLSVDALPIDWEKL